jgi:site-specific recombinase XerD
MTKIDDGLRVVRGNDADGRGTYLLLRWGVGVAPIDRFLQFLADRNMSPNTQRAYAYDLRHFLRFLAGEGCEWANFQAQRAPDLLHYLRHVRSSGHPRRAELRPVSVDGGDAGRVLAPASVHRILAAVASFYEWAIAVGEYDADSPLQRRRDQAARRVSDRHQPFTGLSSRQRPIRRLVGVRRPRRLPRPMADDDLEELFASFRRWRDRAVFLLMLDGGLRPGEVLSLHLNDVSYGRGRVLIAKRDDHPRGVRGKSRIERFVDLADPRTLDAVNQYVTGERPRQSGSPFLFLVGGNRRTADQPLSYDALVRLFARHLDHLGRRTASTTPHALRHTHATAMWDGGMRELTLQKRLGHASPESTRIYTRVSDSDVLADYRAALEREQ